MKTWAVLGFRHEGEATPAYVWHVLAPSAEVAEQEVRQADPGSQEYVLKVHPQALRADRDKPAGIEFRGRFPPHW